MFRGIYMAASGLITDQAWQRVLANNLAQLNTAGYKAENVQVGSFRSALLQNMQLAGAAAIGPGSLGVGVYQTIPDLQPGPVVSTGSPLDVAIQGNAFLGVQTPQGIRYTRDGALSVDSQGNLVTAAGDPVLSTVGTPLKPGPDAVIEPDGRVLGFGGQVIGQIGLYAPTAAQLTDAGQNLWAATGVVAPGQGTFKVGYLEQSNVSPAHEIAAMVQVLRQFQAGQQFVQQDTKTLDQFITAAS